MAIDSEIGEIIKHLLDLLHVGLLINRRVRRHLIAEDLRHLDREDAFLENTFSLDDQIVYSLKPIEMNVPIHPIAGRDRGFHRIF